MTNKYNLDSLIEDLNSKHESVELEIGGETIVLINAMRLAADVRKRVATDIKLLMDEVAKEDQDPVVIDAAINRVLGAIVADGKGQILTDVIAGDTGLAMKVFDIWMTVTQAGEASSSPS